MAIGQLYSLQGKILREHERERNLPITWMKAWTLRVPWEKLPHYIWLGVYQWDKLRFEPINIYVETCSHRIRATMWRASPSLWFVPIQIINFDGYWRFGHNTIKLDWNGIRVWDVAQYVLMISFLAAQQIITNKRDRYGGEGKVFRGRIRISSISA